MDPNDINQDGKIDKNEEKIIKDKIDAQTKMTWIMFFSIIITLVSVLFFISPERLVAIGSLLDMYWIISGSVVGTFVGITCWLKK